MVTAGNDNYVKQLAMDTFLFLCLLNILFGYVTVQIFPEGVGFWAIVRVINEL